MPQTTAHQIHSRCVSAMCRSEYRPSSSCSPTRAAAWSSSSAVAGATTKLGFWAVILDISRRAAGRMRLITGRTRHGGAGGTASL